MRRRYVRLVALSLVLSLPLLAGCREEEQGRPLAHKPGMYLGTQDEQLSPQQLDELRERARRQHFF